MANAQDGEHGGGMSHLELCGDQADLIAAQLTDDVLGDLETHSQGGHDGAPDLLALFDKLIRPLSLIRELVETRQTTERERVAEVAFKRVIDLQDRIGFEYVNSLRAEAGEAEFLEGHVDQTAAVRAYRGRAESDAREALVARQVFELVRDRDSVAQGGGS